MTKVDKPIKTANITHPWFDRPDDGPKHCRVKPCASTINAETTISVNYIYFPLSDSKYVSFTNMENITLISLWAVAITAIL